MNLPFTPKRGGPSPITLADRAREAGQWELAARHYRSALERNPDRAPIWVQYGHALKESGRRAQAEAAYRRAVAYAPTLADTHLQLGHVLKLAGDRDAAKTAYLRALALDPKLSAAREELARLGWDERNAAELQTALATPAAAPARRRGRRSRIARADEARDAALWGVAARLYREALDRNPRNPPIWVQYGHALKEDGRVPEAEAAYRRALALDPRAADIHLQLGHALKLQGKTEDAQSAYLRAFVLAPALSDTLPELGRLGWSEAETSELRSIGNPNHSTGIADPGASQAGPPHFHTPVRPVDQNLPDGELLQQIARSGLFDKDWYLLNNPHVALSEIDPVIHYLQSGAAEGRDPHPLFDGDWYLAHNRDVAEAGINPLQHYVRSGASEGRQPRPADRLSPECGVLEIPFEIWRAPAALAGRDVCLFVTYSPSGHVFDHVVHYLNCLAAEGFAIVLVIVTDGINQVLRPELECAEGILVRTNHGWDFAAWAAGLAIFPDLWNARTLILANDSVYGPISRDQFKAVIDRIRSSNAGVVALTDSYEVRHHVQSYFIALTATGLASSGVREFWQNVRSIRDKWTVIEKYEIALLENLRINAISTDVLFPIRENPTLGWLNPNPTATFWKELIGRGFPFLKVQLLRDKLEQADPTGWENCISNEQLLRCIHDHLSSVRNAEPALPNEYRPIPAPKRRFKRSTTLQTPYGATPACRPTEASDLALEVPFRHVTSDDHTGGAARIAVLLHLYYPHMSNEFLNKINNIPVGTDIFISTDTEDKKNIASSVFSAYRNGIVEVRVFPNVGRDIAAMLVGYADVIERYDIILHIHSKESSHNPALARWRDFLLDNLLGSPEIVSSILEIFNSTDVGVVCGQHFPAVRGILNFGMNFDIMKRLLAVAGVSLSKDLVLEFPSGSFFWATSKAIKPLLGMSLDWSDFAPEPIPVDGTLAHAIERSILYFCESTGQRWVKVAQAGGEIDPSTLVPVLKQSEIDTAVTRVHRWLTANPVELPNVARPIPGVSLARTKRDLINRPRLNIIVPNLYPDNFFGGLTTAINLFTELAGHLGDAFDYRIISAGGIDMASMRQFPEYRLVSLGAAFDQFPKSIVDVSDSEIGELSLRATDIFIATAWWTAVTAYELQAAQALRHGRAHPTVYLIQDHEPGFYESSSRYSLAQETYTTSAKKIAIINSEELTDYMVHRYPLRDVYTLPFRINPVIERALKPAMRERIIVFYGRPDTPRNCFEIIAGAIAQWQRSDPIEARRWQIISAGEQYSPAAIPDVQNLTVVGKLSLEAYGALLSKASVGISLMMSPHPSYPPLEMAFAGLVTVSNTFEQKDLSKRSANIISISVISERAVATALSEAVLEANARLVGTGSATGKIAAIPNSEKMYNAAEFASRLSQLVSSSVS